MNFRFYLNSQNLTIFQFWILVNCFTTFILNIIVNLLTPKYLIVLTEFSFSLELFKNKALFVLNTSSILMIYSDVLITYTASKSSFSYLSLSNNNSGSFFVFFQNYHIFLALIKIKCRFCRTVEL